MMQTFEETERRHWETMESEWEREKQRILNALGGSGQEGWDFPQETEVYTEMQTDIRCQCNVAEIDLHKCSSCQKRYFHLKKNFQSIQGQCLMSPFQVTCICHFIKGNKCINQQKASCTPDNCVHNYLSVQINIEHLWSDVNWRTEAYMIWLPNKSKVLSHFG